MDPSFDSPQSTAVWLQARFGLGSLRPMQAEVVHKLIQGRRVLFVAPTGHGKSLCYQGLAAAPRPGVVLVFTPLKALMVEQVERARERGLRAEFVNSDQDLAEQVRHLDAAVNKNLDLLFIAPERMGNESWKDRVPNMAVKGIVIDEAHCISQWGHDFRPYYRRLVNVVLGLGLRTPVLAVTATAPDQVVTDVAGQLAPRTYVAGQLAPRLQSIDTLRLSSVRPNIGHQVWWATDDEQRLAHVLQAALARADRPGIAYFVTTRDAELAARLLVSRGVDAVAYHASIDDREGRLQKWRSSGSAVICSTSALGMGMDRADVRWVLHAGMPSSLIQYVQEIGRAGRDGFPAEAIAIEDAATNKIQHRMVDSSAPDVGDYTKVIAAVDRGTTTRTGLIDELDLPQSYMQRLLDDLVEAEALTREGAPAQYGRGSGRPPETAKAARDVKTRLLAQATAWAGSTECRRVSLASAMGDAAPPACGCCDRCILSSPPVPTARMLASIRAFLDADRPEIGKETGALGRGLALSWYDLGEIGKAVAAAKRAGQPAPDVLVDVAVQALRTGPFVGFKVDSLVFLPPTKSGKFVEGFARALGKKLGVPVVGLTKARSTHEQKKFRAKQNKAKNIKGSFKLIDATDVQYSVLLVDDIWDSGATMGEAASLLRRAGRSVRPLVLARTRHSDDQ